MAKRTPTKRTATHPDVTTPAFVGWVKANLDKRRGRAVALQALQVELLRRRFSEDGETLSLVRALGDPRAGLLAEHALIRPLDLRTRRGFRAVEVARVWSALTALVFSDPRVDFADRWRDAKMILPAKALAVCSNLNHLYMTHLADESGRQGTQSRTRTRGQEDQRQVRSALWALREIGALMTDYADDVERGDVPVPADEQSRLRMHEVLYSDEQELIAVAQTLKALSRSHRESYPEFHEFARALVSTLKAEALSRKEVVGLTLAALLPITSNLQRVAAALAKPRQTKKGGAATRAMKVAEYDRWCEKAGEVWKSHPELPALEVARRVIRRLGLDKSPGRVARVIRKVKPAS